MLAVTAAVCLLQSPDIVAPGAELIKVQSGFSFTEGPTADKKGNVYFTDQPNDAIYRWDAKSGKAEVWMKPAGRSNGLAFDRRGKLIACADELNQLWEISPDRKAKVLIERNDAGLLNGPNDVWVTPKNGLFFTDPLYARPYWKRNPKSQQTGQHVYFVTPDRKSVRVVAGDLRQPNGIVGSRDGKTLYVADIGAGKTYRYAVAPDGTLSDKTLYCPQGSDGMGMDERGNLYLTGQGVTIYNPAGEKIHQIPVPEGWTANLTFGGKDGKTLFITASTSIYALQMTVRGE